MMINQPWKREEFHNSLLDEALKTTKNNQAMIEAVPSLVPENANAANINPESVEPKKSFGQKIGGFFTNLRNDPARMANLALAFNTMRLQPDAGLAQTLGATAAEARQQKRIDRRAETFATYLEGKGMPDQAKLIRKNPEMATELSKHIFSPEKGMKSYAPQQDKDGRIFTTQYDFTKGKPEITYLKDANGDYITSWTPQDEIDIKAYGARKEKVSGSIESFRGQRNTLNVYLSTLKDMLAKNVSNEEIETLWNQWLPATTGLRASLKSFEEGMALETISGGSFGALSEGEMSWVRDIATPPAGLTIEQRIDWAKRKVGHIDKFIQEIEGDYLTMSQFATYDDLVKYRAEQRSKKEKKEKQNPETPAKTKINPIEARVISSTQATFADLIKENFGSWEQMNQKQQDLLIEQYLQSLGG